MAAKSENKFSVLQMPLPESGKVSKLVKADWTGLNLRQTVDTGALTMEKNISTDATPYIIPSEKRTEYLLGYEKPIGIYGFEDFLIVIYYNNSSIMVDYITADKKKYTGELNGTNEFDETIPRQVVKFNVYQTNSETKEGEYIYKLLFFPDRMSMDYYLPDDADDDYKLVIEGMDVIPDMVTFWNVESPYMPTVEDVSKKNKEDCKTATVWWLNTYNNLCFRWEGESSGSKLSLEKEDGETVFADKGSWVGCVPYGFPKLKYVTVHLSRLFGVDDDTVYASGFNDYTNWDLDTAESYSDAHAWMSAAQSNTKANGKFTGIFTYQNHVICFKEDFMHELTNTKNPFRIQDVFAEGCIDMRTVQDVDGQLIFVSRDGIKVYTGGNPRILGYELNIDEFEYAVSGTDGRKYYLYYHTDNTNRRLLVYDTWVGRWAEEEISEEVIGFSKNKNGMFMLCKNGTIYRMDTDDYSHKWCFETDINMNNTADIKHIKKIQLVADIPQDSKIKIYLLYDGAEFDYENIDANNKNLVFDSKKQNKTGNLTPIRILVHKTANYGFKLHFEGEGYAKIRQMEMIMSAGGDLNR